MNFSYTVQANKDFDSCVSEVEKISASKGFKVLFIHDVKSTLEGKGFKREPFKIIEICKADFAHTALDLEIDVGLFMPCKINVFTKGGSTYISAMRPALISDFFENQELKIIADEVDNIIRSIVDEAK